MTSRCATCHGPLVVRNQRQLVRYCSSACRRNRHREKWIAMKRRPTPRILAP